MMPLLVRWLHAHFIQLQDWYQQSLPNHCGRSLHRDGSISIPLKFFFILFGSIGVAICPLSPRDHIVDIKPLYKGAFKPLTQCLARLALQHLQTEWSVRSLQIYFAF